MAMAERPATADFETVSRTERTHSDFRSRCTDRVLRCDLRSGIANSNSVTVNVPMGQSGVISDVFCPLTN